MDMGVWSQGGTRLPLLIGSEGSQEVLLGDVRLSRNQSQNASTLNPAEDGKLYIMYYTYVYI